MSEEEKAEFLAGELKDEPRDMTEMWVEGELKFPYVKNWVRQKIEEKKKGGQYVADYDEEEIRQVAHSLYKLYQVDKEKAAPGDFINAVLDNSLVDAYFKSDYTHRKSLWLFVEFIWFVAPSRFADEICS